MAIEVFHGSTLVRELTSSATEYLWAKWQTLNSIRSLSLQRLTEESDTVTRDDLAFLIPAGTDDFVFMYVGKNIQTGFRRDPTGSRLVQSGHPVAKAAGEVFRQVSDTMTPAFFRFPGRRVHNGLMWQGLVLPLQLDSMVMLACHLEQTRPSSDVYEQLFHGSPDAVIVARPVNADAGNVVDGRIVAMNKAARVVLGFHGEIGHLRLSQLPKLKSLQLGFKLPTQPAERSALQIFRSDDFDIEVIRFPDVFAVRLHMHRPVIALGAKDSAPDLAPA